MRALSIRQPYAEFILRGLKTIEYRSQPTKIIGERFYIYAARKWAGLNGDSLPGVEPDPESLPTGVIVGTAVISHCTEVTGSQAGACATCGTSPTSSASPAPGNPHPAAAPNPSGSALSDPRPPDRGPGPRNAPRPPAPGHAPTPHHPNRIPTPAPATPLPPEWWLPPPPPP